MNLPAVVSPHVAALAARCATAERMARLLCQAAGYPADERNTEGVPLWRFYVAQAHGLIDLSEKGKAA